MSKISHKIIHNKPLYAKEVSKVPAFQPRLIIKIPIHPFQMLNGLVEHWISALVSRPSKMRLSRVKLIRPLNCKYGGSDVSSEEL